MSADISTCIIAIGLLCVFSILTEGKGVAYKTYCVLPVSNTLASGGPMWTGRGWGRLPWKGHPHALTLTFSRTTNTSTIKACRKSQVHCRKWLTTTSSTPSHETQNWLWWRVREKRGGQQWGMANTGVFSSSGTTYLKTSSSHFLTWRNWAMRQQCFHKRTQPPMNTLWSVREQRQMANGSV